jgi:hypothetical protein
VNGWISTRTQHRSPTNGMNRKHVKPDGKEATHNWEMEMEDKEN